MSQILDACCGSKMMHSDKHNPMVVYVDNRKESLLLKDKNCKGGYRKLDINPDVVSDFRNMPFDSESFNLVVFDPPHLIKAGDKSWLKAKYGRLNLDNWKDDISKGFNECWRVLRKGGTLIFKWNEDQIKINEVLKLAPVEPVFGHLTGRKGLTHWLVFYKGI